MDASGASIAKNPNSLRSDNGFFTLSLLDALTIVLSGRA